MGISQVKRAYLCRLPNRIRQVVGFPSKVSFDVYQSEQGTLTLFTGEPQLSEVDDALEAASATMSGKCSKIFSARASFISVKHSSTAFPKAMSKV
jgi:hypothetical protein